MKKATKSRSKKITVKVGRATERDCDLTLPEGSTVEDVLDEADIGLRDSESVWVDGEKADFNDEVQDGDLLQITGKKEGGR